MAKDGAKAGGKTTARDADTEGGISFDCSIAIF